MHKITGRYERHGSYVAVIDQDVLDNRIPLSFSGSSGDLDLVHAIISSATLGIGSVLWVDGCLYDADPAIDYLVDV